jgi:phosphonate transport system substrate-binding protein
MKQLFIAFLILVIILNSGCTEQQKKINLSIVAEPDVRENDTAIKVAIASVISPKESYMYYEEMIQYISRELGGKVKILQRRNYSEVNELIRNNNIDFAFVCSGAYVDGNSDFGMKLLVAPTMYGKTTYNSYLIVPKNSSYNDLADLRGKKFAFSDPLSNSGKLYPTYRLWLMNETPESFFGVDDKGKSNYFYTYSHDSSITAVAEGLADGAAVDSLVYMYLNSTRPEVTSKTRIIEISPSFGIPPVVVSKEIDPYLEERLKFIFLNMKRNQEGERILSSIHIDSFVNINDSDYDSVRKMKENIK